MLRRDALQAIALVIGNGQYSEPTFQNSLPKGQLTIDLGQFSSVIVTHPAYKEPYRIDTKELFEALGKE